MKAAELTGAQLDYWVAKAAGLKNPRINTRTGYAPIPGDEPYCMYGDRFGFMPSTEWRDGGPIIERERISVTFPEVDPGPGFEWHANIAQPDESFNQYGPTPLIAAMRAYVTSKYGDEVQDIV